MAPSWLHLLLGAGCLAAICVFTAAFRFALRECAEPQPHRHPHPHRIGDLLPDLPRAAIHHGGARWTVGHNKQRALHSVRLLQAGFVAMGITSVVVMATCMAGIFGLLIFG